MPDQASAQHDTGPPLRTATRAAGRANRVGRPGTIARLMRDYRALLRGLYSILLALAAWEVIGRTILTSKLMFAPLSAVLAEFAKLWGTGELARHMLVSFTALACGFAMAAAFGIALGSLLALSRTLREHLEPLINALYATPLIALSPILILALGIGPASKIAIVFLMAVFPILINSSAGILSAEESLIEAARSFCATRAQIFRHILLPSALPFIVAGLRLGIGKGLVGIFIGELFGAREGVGYLISVSAQSFDVPGMFVGVLILAGAGMLFGALLEYLERRIAPWRQFELKA